VHPRRASWSRCGEDERADERRPHERDLLGDETTDREPEQVNPLAVEPPTNAIIWRAVLATVLLASPVDEPAPG
jgi:hypothetical protein